MDNFRGFGVGFWRIWSRFAGCQTKHVNTIIWLTLEDFVQVGKGLIEWSNLIFVHWDTNKPFQTYSKSSEVSQIKVLTCLVDTLLLGISWGAVWPVSEPHFFYLPRF